MPDPTGNDRTDAHVQTEWPECVAPVPAHLPEVQRAFATLADFLLMKQ
jgi:hypothetical protein